MGQRKLNITLYFSFWILLVGPLWWFEMSVVRFPILNLEEYEFPSFDDPRLENIQIFENHSVLNEISWDNLLEG